MCHSRCQGGWAALWDQGQEGRKTSVPEGRREHNMRRAHPHTHSRYNCATQLPSQDYIAHILRAHFDLCLSPLVPGHPSRVVEDLVQTGKHLFLLQRHHHTNTVLQLGQQHGPTQEPRSESQWVRPLLQPTLSVQWTCSYLSLPHFRVDVVQELVEELIPRQVAEEAVAALSSPGVQAVAKAVLALKVS